MSEKMSDNPGARFFKAMEGTKSQLDDSQKSLVEIHPAVSTFVETDTESEDFGRIKDTETAHGMANELNETFDAFEGEPAAQSVMDMDEAELDQETADRIWKRGTGTQTEKAGEDYLITQGNRHTMHRRGDAVMKALINGKEDY